MQRAQDARLNPPLVVSENVEISPSGNESKLTFTFGPLNPTNEGLVSTMGWKTVGTEMHGVEVEHGKIQSGVRAWEGEKKKISHECRCNHGNPLC